MPSKAVHPYSVTFSVDENNDVHVDIQWPVNESPHVVTDTLGGLIAAMTGGALDMHITNAVRKFGVTNNRKALTQHVITHWISTRQQMREQQVAYIKPSEVFKQ